MKKQFVIVILILLTLAVIVGLIIVLNKNQSQVNDIREEEWLTYQNEKYNFSFRYPPDWEIFEDDNANKEPIINVYPKSVKVKPPFIHHSDVPNVSVFPKGVPTEGVLGVTSTSTIIFGEPTKQAVDFILVDGERWATVAVFNNPPTSWREYGFAWARTPILDHVQKCLDDAKAEVPVERCYELGETGLTIMDEGRVDKEQQNIEEKILESFRFIP